MNQKEIEKALNYANGSNSLEDNVLTQDEIKIIRDSIIKKETTDNFIKKISEDYDDIIQLNQANKNESEINKNVKIRK